ncbi:MAG: Rpn family recombination-promoting nuclease/putative transposase [Bacteroidia bacterium]|nr:Rpn family recombination-promoting nuclease/putative transposase [Bacteroidia bacterium]
MSKKLIRFDWAMKTLLRDKANFDVLEGFLCALFEDDNVKILHILESETNSEDENDKFNRVDMLVQDSQNRKIYIEIQNTRETDYLESLLYATSKIIVEHQDLGEDFKDISKVVSISILYFNLGTGDDYIYYGTTEFKGLNTGHQLLVKKRINIFETLEPKYKFVEKKIFPEYYLITVERYKNIVQKKIDEWIYMIKNSEIAEDSTSKNIDKAKQKLAKMNMTEAERKRYEKYLINTAKDRDAINTAKEEGREEGREEGEKIGMKKKAKNTTIKLIKKGMSNQEISEIADLSISEIEEIRNFNCFNQTPERLT